MSWSEYSTLTSPSSGAEDLVYGVHWNAIIHHAFRKDFDYLVCYDGTDWMAIDGEDGKIDYGGPNDEGSKDGANPEEVIKGAIDAVSGGTYVRKVVIRGNV